MSQRSAVVTGAASGIGRAVAIRLAEDGFDVILGDIRRDPITGGEPTEDVIRAAGRSAVHVDADVSSADDCDRLVAAAVERTGSLDVIVNNAVLAGDHSKPLLETEPGGLGRDDGRQPARAVPALPGRRAPDADASRWSATLAGRIVNITSQHGMVGCPGHFAYSVGKGGLVQMTRQIAVDYGPQGILCNAVAPGKIVTGTAGDLSASEEGLAYVRSRTPFARLGRSEDVAAAVAYLAGEASYTSGINLMVDGGWMAY